MTSFYKIISEGHPNEGQKREEVIERISVRFKMDTEKAARLVSGKEIVLKSGLYLSGMLTFSNILKSTGLKFNVSPYEVEEELTDSENVADGFACPKCGHENTIDANDPGASCSRCGVIFKKVTAKEKGSETLDETPDINAREGIEVPSDPHQKGIEKVKGLYDELPGSIKIFWRIMVVIYAIALLRVILKGNIVGFVGGAILGGVVWFYIPYYCMCRKGFWAWVLAIVWTFPVGLGLLSQSAKDYFLQNNS